MKIQITLTVAALAWLAGFSSFPGRAQVALSGGPYTQNFDSLATSGTANAWANNFNLPGWYSTRNGTNTASYRAGDGGNNAGDLWSYGVAGISNLTDRALGSVASGSTTPIAFGCGLPMTRLRPSPIFSSLTLVNNGATAAIPPPKRSLSPIKSIVLR